MHIRLALLLLAIGSLALPGRAAAQACSSITWGETRTRSFIFSYQASAPLGAEIAAALGESLDAEFNRFANLFNVSLPAPLLVRVYPNERDYYCFNALAPRIPLGQTHSRIGGREIALIAQNILDDPESWAQQGFEALRFELAVLFVNYLAADHAPEGLQLGTGFYAQDPFIVYEAESGAHPLGEAPGASWRTLWEAPDPVSSPQNVLQAASITAYLVDVYGWDRFVDFLGSLRTAESWRLALEEAYPTDAGALETHWSEVYFDAYRDGRWRENIFHDLSLAPYEQLIAAGAYQAAADGLAEMIALLVDLEDFDRLTLAQELNARAQSGLQADGLARQARQAYLEGDFEAALDFSLEAREQYTLLGDTRNTESLWAIQSRAAEVIELRAELASIEAKAHSLTAARHAPRLIEISSRLQELGDHAGADQAGRLLSTVDGIRQLQSAAAALAGVLLAVFLVLRQVRLLRQAPPPEAMLGP